MSDCCDAPSATGGRTGPFAVVADAIAEANVLRNAGFAILRGGREATVDELGHSTGLGISEVRAALAAMDSRGAAQLDEHGRVVGIGGLSLVPTRHELVLDGVPLHTWCAFDALGIPPALGSDAVTRSHCPHCGKLVEVTFTAGSPDGSFPVAVWVPPSPSPGGNLRQDFCNVANLFCDREHLRAWRDATGPTPGEALTIAEAAERGRATWAQEARWDRSA